MNASDCVFCKIVQGVIPAAVVRKDEQVTAFCDTNPQAPVHILIVPNRHVASLDGLEEQDAGLAGALLRAASMLAVEQGISETGYRVVINTGSQAGQSVFHVHLHLLGGRRMGWPPG